MRGFIRGLLKIMHVPGMKAELKAGSCHRGNSFMHEGSALFGFRRQRAYLTETSSFLVVNRKKLRLWYLGLTAAFVGASSRPVFFSSESHACRDSLISTPQVNHGSRASLGKASHRRRYKSPVSQVSNVRTVSSPPFVIIVRVCSLSVFWLVHVVTFQS